MREEVDKVRDVIKQRSNVREDVGDRERSAHDNRTDGVLGWVENVSFSSTSVVDAFKCKRVSYPSNAPSRRNLIR